MASSLKGTFTENGSSDTFVASRFTILAGSDGSNNFGGGSISIEVSHDGVNYTTDSLITEEGTKTSIDFVGGVSIKLTLSGSTSPSIYYSIKYEE